MRLRMGLCYAWLLGCGTAVDPAGLPSIVGYQSWEHVDVTGRAPGHAGTFRTIYFNEVARTFPHGGRYPVGSVLLKEIRKEQASDPIDYMAIMRKVGDEATTGSAPTNGGWIFSELRDGAEEVHKDSCWANCHRQGPFDGAWFDHGE